MICHGKPLKLDKGKNAKVFYADGVKSATVYSGKCQEKECKKIFFPHYEEDEHDQINFRKFYKPSTFFALTKSSIFETKLLQLITDLVTLGSCEFGNFVYSYNNSLCDLVAKLEIHVLIDAFSMFHLAQKVIITNETPVI